MLDGAKIQTLRKNKGMTLKDLSSKTGISRTKLSNIENEVYHVVDLSHIRKICDVLGILLFDIMKNNEPELLYIAYLKAEKSPEVDKH